LSYEAKSSSQPWGGRAGAWHTGCGDFCLDQLHQRSRFEVVYDGVAWLDTDHGIQASRIAPYSPAPVLEFAWRRPSGHQQCWGHSAAAVARRLDRAGLWTQVRYKLSRGARNSKPHCSPRRGKASGNRDYLRIVGLLYLFIGCSFFIRRWNAPRARALLRFLPSLFHSFGRFHFSASWTL